MKKRTIRYLSHPQVVIDTSKDIQKWSLNDVGKRRVNQLARSGALLGTKVVISSGETKAIETAAPLAKALGCTLEIREKMHENDRSATGILPPDQFEAVADAFFANPHVSVKGWETAAAAQSRIVAEVAECLIAHTEGDLLFVGHGGVGTLLFCHLRGVPISRTFDQSAGGGCFFEFSDLHAKPAKGWQRMEQLGVWS